jgi:copper chaperone CopZ
MCCSKCETKVKEVLRKVAGVVDVITDRHSSLVTVCGKVDPQVALKAVQKTKKKADFYRKQIYSDNFINFIQSKTVRSEPEEEPELTSSYHQHAPSESGDSYHHAYEDNENLSSYEEYPGRDHDHDHDHDHDYHDDAERSSVHSFTIEEDDLMKQRGYYSASYGVPSSSSFNRVEESYRTVDDRPRYEPPFYSYGAPERTPYYERESTSMYGDYNSSYRPSQDYTPSQGYGPNPGYMKRVIRDY